MRKLRFTPHLGFVVALAHAGCNGDTSGPLDPRVDRDASEPDPGEPDGAEPDSSEPDGGALDDGGDAGIALDAAKSACRWEEHCSADGSICSATWTCRYRLCPYDPAYCSCPTQVECGEDEFCSERHVCGARCSKAKGCAGEPCLGDESCAAHEYCSSEETCAVRCTDPTGCEGERCAGDQSCGDDEYCAKARRCAPRCSEDQGCAGPEFVRGHRDRAVFRPGWPLIDDGEKVYFHRFHGWPSDETQHAAAEPEDDVFSWDLEGSPQQIGQEVLQIGQLTVRNGILYVRGRHHTFGTYLRRVPLDGTPQSEIASSQTTIEFWFTGDVLWWSRGPDYISTQAELWRALRLGAGLSELVAIADHDGWRAGNEAVVFRASDASGTELQTFELVRDTLPGLESSQTIGTYARARRLPSVPGTDTMVVGGDSLFITLGALGTELVRIDLDNPSESVPLASPDLETRNVLVEGSWVYWGAQLDDTTATINRTHRDGASAPQELMRGDLAPNLFTVTADSLVYSNGERFFVMPLPEQP